MFALPSAGVKASEEKAGKQRRDDGGSKCVGAGKQDRLFA